VVEQLLGCFENKLLGAVLAWRIEVGRKLQDWRAKRGYPLDEPLFSLMFSIESHGVALIIFDVQCGDKLLGDHVTAI
jgi:hypothetical protein